MSDMPPAIDQWLRHPLITLTGLWVAVAIGKSLVSPDPVNYKKLLGEIILAGVGAFIFYAFGLYQDMTTEQTLFFGALGGWGGVRALEHTIKIVLSFKNKL